MPARTIERNKKEPHHIEPTVELRSNQSPVDVVMVKFTVNKRHMVPAGINERQRGTDSQADVKQQFAAIQSGNAELAEVGRVRPGRVDTGENRITVQNGIRVGFIRRNLTSSGFRLTSVQFYERQQQFGKPKFVVECVYTRTTEAVEPFTDKAVEGAIRSLATTTFMNCHVWVNPNLTCTINLSGRNPDATPDGTLVVKDHKLQYEKL